MSCCSRLHRPWKTHGFAISQASRACVVDPVSLDLYCIALGSPGGDRLFVHLIKFEIYKQKCPRTSLKRDVTSLEENNLVTIVGTPHDDIMSIVYGSMPLLYCWSRGAYADKSKSKSWSTY